MTALSLSFQFPSTHSPRGFSDRELAADREVKSSAALELNLLMPWWPVTKSRVRELMSLPENWDFQGASKIHSDTAVFALTMLEQLLGADSPAPQIVPLAFGGLQFEWHENDIDLEIEVAGPNEVYVFFDDHQAEEGDGDWISSDVPLTHDFSCLEGPISLLSAR